MNKCIAVSFCIALACLMPSRASAAAFELIPSGKQVNHNAGGDVYDYRVFYIDNKNRSVSLCFATLDAKKNLSLKCGGVLNTKWKLPGSSNVKTQAVGRLDYFEDDPLMPLGLWQVDEITGDWQFCISSDAVGGDNCVLAKTPQ